MRTDIATAHIDKALVSLSAPGSFGAEQYQSLRLKLERLQQVRGVRVLAVTSPGASDGKTITSINLAGALAHGTSARVLLIDADLRRPSIGTHLGLANLNDLGLSDVIGDARLGLGQVARQVDQVDNLSVVLAGSKPASVHALLRSPRFELLLQEARAGYDFVVLDTPPLVPVCDAALLARLVDGVLIVVAADGTPRKQLEEALNLIDESAVLGIVFNGDNASRYGEYDVYARQ